MKSIGNYLSFYFLFTSIVFIGRIDIVKASSGWLPIKLTPAQNITGLYAHKSSAVLIATTIRGEIFKSPDSGNTWDLVSEFKDSIFTLAAWDDSYILAGGRGNIYKSLDSGKTWSVHPLPFKAAVGKIVFHPSGDIFIGTGSPWDAWGGSKGNGIFISTDSAKTWQVRNTGIGKENPLIESLAIAPTGQIFAGIADPSAGQNGRFGIFVSSNKGVTWSRLPVNVLAPFAQDYNDTKFRISHVMNIAIAEGQILAAISGIYSNFAVGFTIKCPVENVNNPNNIWNVHWVTDSIPLTGSDYMQTVSLHQDAMGNYWSSIAIPATEVFNNIYSNSSLVSATWNFEMDGLEESYGRFIFAEDGNGNLYTISYFTGEQIFTRSIFEPSGISNAEKWKNLISVFPVPATSKITIQNLDDETRSIRIFDVAGNVTFSDFNPFSDGGKYHLNLPASMQKGLYILEINGEKDTYMKKIVLE